MQQQNNQKSNILFITQSCDRDGSSKNLLTLLNNNNLLYYFNVVNIDNNPEIGFKYGIKKIPAIITMYQTNNGMNPFLRQSKEAFDWVFSVIESRKNAENKDRISTNNSNLKNNFLAGILDYCPSEHGGNASDKYAYYNEDLKKDEEITKAHTKMYSQPPDIKNPDNLFAVPVGKMNDYKKQAGLNTVYGGATGINKILKTLEDARKQQEQDFGRIMFQDFQRNLNKNERL